MIKRGNATFSSTLKSSRSWLFWKINPIFSFLKIIFSSSASVYGNPSKQRVLESDTLDPLNPYALSKLNLEKFLIEKSKKITLS